MSKYKYAFVIQVAVSPTVWKDLLKLAYDIGKADAVSQFLEIKSRNRELNYRLIKRRYINE